MLFKSICLMKLTEARRELLFESYSHEGDVVVDVVVVMVVVVVIVVIVGAVFVVSSHESSVADATTRKLPLCSSIHISTCTCYFCVTFHAS